MFFMEKSLEMIVKIIDWILHIDKYLNVLIQSYGAWIYLLIFLIVFIETGFVFVPFLPGDSLLFASGTFAAVGSLNVYVIFLLLSLAAILGDTVNYWMGKYFGERVFSRFIREEYMERTREFYKKHGKKTIVLARFVPIIRTFAPFVAGIGRMDYPTFLSYNVIGGISWVALFLFAGYFFGNLSFVKNNLMIIILFIIIISFVPVIIEYAKHRRNSI